MIQNKSGKRKRIKKEGIRFGDIKYNQLNKNNEKKSKPIEIEKTSIHASSKNIIYLSKSKK